MQQFELAGREYVALHNLLKLADISDSGGGAKQLVAAGQVLVDGQVELRKRCKIRAGQRVQCGGHVIEVIA